MTSYDNRVWLIGAHNRQGPGSLETCHGIAQSLDQVALGRAIPGIFKQVCYDLTVGVALELVTCLFKLCTQILIVLDNAIVDDCDLAGAVGMGVCVSVGGDTVGSPTGVADTAGTDKICVLYTITKGCYTALTFDHMKIVVRGNRRNARRVIATILKRCETIQKKVNSFVGSGTSYNSAHISASGFSSHLHCYA